MAVEYLHTNDAPGAIGPYSQATKAGGFLFTAGQIALDPVSTQVVEGDVAAQADRVMKHLQAVLTAAGCAWKDVVKTTIFLKNMSDFPKVNQVYASYFKEVPPARSTIEVARLPRDVLVEIETANDPNWRTCMSRVRDDARQHRMTECIAQHALLSQHQKGAGQSTRHRCQSRSRRDLCVQHGPGFHDDSHVVPLQEFEVSPLSCSRDRRIHAGPQTTLPKANKAPYDR